MRHNLNKFDEIQKHRRPKSPPPPPSRVYEPLKPFADRPKLREELNESLEKFNRSLSERSFHQPSDSDESSESDPESPEEDLHEENSSSGEENPERDKEDQPDRTLAPGDQSPSETPTRHSIIPRTKPHRVSFAPTPSVNERPGAESSPHPGRLPAKGTDQDETLHGGDDLTAPTRLPKGILRNKNTNTSETSLIEDETITPSTSSNATIAPGGPPNAPEVNTSIQDDTIIQRTPSNPTSPPGRETNALNPISPAPTANHQAVEPVTQVEPSQPTTFRGYDDDDESETEDGYETAEEPADPKDSSSADEYEESSNSPPLGEIKPTKSSTENANTRPAGDDEKDEENIEQKLFDTYESIIPQDDDSLVPENITISRDGLTFEPDNIVHFLNTDCEPASETSKFLNESNMINFRILKTNNPRLGDVMVQNKGNLKIFIVFIKESAHESEKPNQLKTSMKNLHEALKRYEVTTFRTSDIDTELRRAQSPLASIMFKEFKTSPIKITICTGRIVTPPIFHRDIIIRENHNSLHGGHSGIVKTYLRIRERYYWPGMKADIQKYIERCKTCQLKKSRRIKIRQPMQITDTPRDKFEKISLDIVGPLPPTPSGNINILTIQDNFTKFLIAIPLPDARAVTIAEAIVTNYVNEYGCPKIFLTDRGPNFVSKLLAHLSRILDVTHVTTSGYRPESNGALERTHHVLVEYLRTFSSKHRDWDVLLKDACFSYNTTVHSATKFTPFELQYGKRARLPTSFRDIEDFEHFEDYLVDYCTRQEELKTLVRDNIIDSKEKSKGYYDRKAKKVEFPIGSFAYVLKEPRMNKLDDYYLGPYEVIGHTPRGDIKLETMEGDQFYRHPNKLKKCAE